MSLAAEPATFDERVRRPGLRAIAEMVGKAPRPPRKAGRPFKKVAAREADLETEDFPAYWTDALDDLMAAYRGVCAYSCFRIHPITGARTTDHFIARSRAWRKVYEWSNYRLCASLLNSRKREFDDVLDPFLVRPGWFQLELVGFQVLPNPRASKSTRKAVQDSIDRLGLNDSAFRKQREDDAEGYWAGGCSLGVLREESPFVAAELRRHGRLNPGDRW